MALTELPARQRGPVTVSVTQDAWDEAQVEVTALRIERIEDARRMRKVIPYVRFARSSADDVAADRALGIVQLEVERIARRGGGDAA